MPPIDIKKEMRHINRPVMILSTRAGLGNYSVGKTLFEILGDNLQVQHYSLEDLICDSLKHTDFLRYRNICENNPWLLYFYYKIPINYCLKYLREAYFRNLDLGLLKEKINSLGVKTVIATNNRAAFCLSALKKRKEIDCSIVVFLTDYSFSPGWNYIFWSYIDRIFGPIEGKDIPLCLRSRYNCVGIPVLNKYRELSERNGNKNNVLVSGGGWGLGRIFPLCQVLANQMPFLMLHIAVGDNEDLYKQLNVSLGKYKNVYIYRNLESLDSLMEICGVVITKPGALTISEASAAGRKIFLIKGIPGCEYENMKYAQRYLKAEIFSLSAFEDWYKEIIFFGDSQIAFWDIKKFFGSLPVRNKGISGLCSDRALVDFEEDVLKHDPKTVIILIGTNDIAMRRKKEDIASDLSQMVVKSKAARVVPVLCSVLPVRGIYRFTRPLENLRSLNILIKNIADDHKVSYIDFGQYMMDSKGELKRELTRDGLHPNLEGYALMTSILQDKFSSLGIEGINGAGKE